MNSRVKVLMVLLVLVFLSASTSLPTKMSPIPIPSVYASLCGTLPVKIYDSGVWQWWITDNATCSLYLANQVQVSLFFPFPDMLVNWFHDNLGGTNLLASPMILNLLPAGGGAYSTGGNTIGVAIDSFYSSTHGIEAFWAYLLIAQEFTNAYTGKTVSGGFPTDWWADDRSPFPLVTAVEANIGLNWKNSTAAGKAQYGANSADPQVVMFKQLYDTYGARMFDSAFSAMRSDGISWENIATPPSTLLTNYVAAYLMIGANANLTPILNGIVPGYDDTKAQNIRQARTNLQTTSRTSQLWAEYLKGDYAPALSLEAAVSVLSYAVIGAIIVVTVVAVVLFGVLLAFRSRGPRYGPYGAPKFCMSCGRPLSGSERFCDRCGAPQV